MAAEIGEVTVPSELAGGVEWQIHESSERTEPSSSKVRRLRLPFMTVLAASVLTGCTVAEADSRQRTVERVSPFVQAERLLPQHRSILAETGWLAFVTSNVDAIQYYDWEAFASPDGPAVGQATYEEDRRIARLAVKSRDENDVVATLVHEAAHLSGIAQVGRLYGEEIASAVEGRFNLDRQKLSGVRPSGETTNPRNQADSVGVR